MRGRNIVAIAGGPSKVAGIRAALASGLLKGLITDELTARRLVNKQSEAISTRRAAKESRRVKINDNAKGVKT